MKRILILGACIGALVACENPQFRAREKGALGGAAMGAGLGAIVGNQTGSTGAGIAIGSAIGALSGALIGQQVDSADDGLAARDARIQEQERQLQENRRLIDELRKSGADARSTSRGVVVNLPDVLFEFNSARLTGGAQNTVREIARVVKTSGDRKIAIEGHTDAVGTVSYNQRLSEDRARSVANDLVVSGVQRRRMVVEGYGETHPIASNNTDEGRSRNRRVEVIIENR